MFRRLESKTTITDAETLARQAREHAERDEVPMWVSLRDTLRDSYRGGTLPIDQNLSQLIQQTWRGLLGQLPSELRWHANSRFAQELALWLAEVQREDTVLRSRENQLRLIRQNLGAEPSPQ